MSNIVNVRVRPGRAPKQIPSIVNDELCLNFINTLDGRHTSYEKDCLTAGEDVVDFMVHAGVLDWPTAKGLHGRLANRKGAYTRLLKRAVEIREILAALFFCIKAGDTPPPEDVSALDGYWKEITAEGSLSYGEGGFERVWNPETSPASFLLGPVIGSFFELTSHADPKRMKSCPAEDCNFTFYDHTKNNSRVWCQMATCGNRAKVRRFTQKQKKLAAS